MSISVFTHITVIILWWNVINLESQITEPNNLDIENLFFCTFQNLVIYWLLKSLVTIPAVIRSVNFLHMKAISFREIEIRTVWMRHPRYFNHDNVILCCAFRNITYCDEHLLSVKALKHWLKFNLFGTCFLKTTLIT